MLPCFRTEECQTANGTYKYIEFRAVEPLFVYGTRATLNHSTGCPKCGHEMERKSIEDELLTWYLRCCVCSVCVLYVFGSHCCANSLRSGASFRLLPGRLVHVASLVFDTGSMFDPTGTSNHLNIFQLSFRNMLWRFPTIFIWKATPILTLLWLLEWPPWPLIAGGHPHISRLVRS